MVGETLTTAGARQVSHRPKSGAMEFGIHPALLKCPFVDEYRYQHSLISLFLSSRLTWFFVFRLFILIHHAFAVKGVI